MKIEKAREIQRKAVSDGRDSCKAIVDAVNAEYKLTIENILITHGILKDSLYEKTELKNILADAANISRLRAALRDVYEAVL